jgi:succinate dehydrogenase hydrophobic anchor subunit
METGMHTETLKNAKVAVFLNRSALCLLMLPVACLFWALHAYPPRDACLLCFVLATYAWPFAGVLFLVSAGFHAGTGRQRLEEDTSWREAHGH